MVSVGTCQSRGPDTAQSQGPQQPIRMIGKSHGVAPGTEGVSAGKSVYWREGGWGGGTEESADLMTRGTGTGGRVGSAKQRVLCGM